MEEKLNKPLSTKEKLLKFVITQRIIEDVILMHARGIVQASAGSGGFVLEDVTVDTEINEAKLAIRPMNGSSVRCGVASVLGDGGGHSFTL